MIQNKIQTLLQLKTLIEEDLTSGKFQTILIKANYVNPWFTENNILQAITSIKNNFFNEEKLLQWITNYSKIGTQKVVKNVGIICAGNIPMVGFHDVLCGYLTNHNLFVKLSSKDEVLMKYLIDGINAIDKQANIEITEKLSGFDAVLATGSNNTFRYFDAYFSIVPNIIRKNRNSVAILTGDETKEDLTALGIDIFSYFGFGCRNVCKLYIPNKYNFSVFFESIQPYSEVAMFNKYFNNYEYSKALYLLNRDKHLDNGFLLLREESEKIAAPTAVIYFQYYQTISELEELLYSNKEQIQCVVSKLPIERLKITTYGNSQNPDLWDYADNVDTIEFLLNI